MRNDILKKVKMFIEVHIILSILEFEKHFHFRGKAGVSHQAHQVP